MAIKITHYVPFQKEGLCKGKFSCYIEEWDLHFRDLREMITHDGRKFIAYPQKDYEDKKTGEKKYYSYYSFGKEKNEVFLSQLRIALTAFKEANGFSDQAKEKSGLPF